MMRRLARLRPSLLVALPVLLLASATAFGIRAWSMAGTNRTIAALEAGTDAEVSPGAPAPLLAARIAFLAKRGRLDEAEPLLSGLNGDDDQGDLARARYTLANARMRDAFGLLARGDLDKAGPLVTLSRQDYRRALRARPDYWDAKFNLDVASRLIRDYPELNRKDGDELQSEPKKIWTDIPGQPRGGP